jgi:putative ABC transport system permease protein
MGFEYVKIAFAVLRAHKFRAALTMLSITIGAFSIVLMTSLAQSGLATLARSIEELGGARLLAVFPNKPERASRKRESYSHGLRRADLELLGERVPHVAGYAILVEGGDKAVRQPDGTQKVTSLMGGDANFLPVFGMKVALGRNLTAEDDVSQRKVCVIGPDLAGDLFPHGGNPLGQVLTIENQGYRVVGVTEKLNRFGVSFGWEWNDFVLVPEQVLAPPAADFTGWLIMRTEDARQNDIAKRVVNSLMVARHRGVDDFVIFDFASSLNKWHSIFAIMESIVGLLAGIALLVGGVGVMNILLVSVRERVREIGLRKAIGATPLAIRTQFVVEAVVLSLLGGGIGVFAGAASATAAGQVIRHFQSTWVGVVSQGAMLAAVLVSALIGVIFGYVPARRAGRLDPVECLRS